MTESTDPSTEETGPATGVVAGSGSSVAGSGSSSGSGLSNTTWFSLFAPRRAQREPLLAKAGFFWPKSRLWLLPWFRRDPGVHPGIPVPGIPGVLYLWSFLIAFPVFPCIPGIPGVPGVFPVFPCVPGKARRAVFGQKKPAFGQKRRLLLARK